MKNIMNIFKRVSMAACCVVILSAWYASAQVMHVNLVSVDSVWNSDSSWYDSNGVLQQRYSRDCRISFSSQDTGGIAQCSVSVSLDSGKTWDPTPNPMQVLEQCYPQIIGNIAVTPFCMDSSRGQEGFFIVRVLGQDRPNVTFKVKTNICVFQAPSTADLIGKWVFSSVYMTEMETMHFGIPGFPDTTIHIDTTITMSGNANYAQFNANMTYSSQLPAMGGSAADSGTWSISGSSVRLISTSGDTTNMNVSVSGNSGTFVNSTSLRMDNPTGTMPGSYIRLSIASVFYATKQ